MRAVEEGGASHPAIPVVPAPEVIELEALNGGALLAQLPGHGRLTLTGADRLDFLHGQIANDVKGLPVGGVNVSLLLNHRGHALAQMTVLRAAESLDVVVEDEALPVVEESLRRHIIFDQVTLEERPGHVTLTLQGPSAAEVLGAVTGETVPADGTFRDARVGGQPVLVASTRRLGRDGYDLYLQQAALETVRLALEEAGATWGSPAAVELERVRAGVPRAGSEGGEGILPQEAGLERYLSYRKGCYLGQEIMARIEARGKMRRGLSALSLERIPTGRDVMAGGRKVGRVGTVATLPGGGLVALAVMRNDIPADSELQVGDAPARLLELPPASAS